MTETLYGRNAVYESLRAGRRKAYKLTLARGMRQSDVVDQILALARQAGVGIQRVDRHQLDQVGDVNHQGVALEVARYPYAGLDEILSQAKSADEAPLLLLLDVLKDPQNVGTLIRTAEAVGVHGVVIQRRRAVGITPSVVRASSGAVEHLPVAQVTNISRTIEQLKEEGVWVAGLEATPEAEIAYETDLTGALAMVVGSEGKGMRRLVRERCDFLVRLPMQGRVASLNASVAGSVALYEVLRQRRAKAAG